MSTSLLVQKLNTIIEKYENEYTYVNNFIETQNKTIDFILEMKQYIRELQEKNRALIIENNELKQIIQEIEESNEVVIVNVL